LHRLCADLSGILETPIEVHGDEGKVPTTRIQPIGLILNELVTNAAKHGAGSINVKYTIVDGTHELSVCDEGPGLPNDFNLAGTAGLGMKVVTTLAKQLGGQMTTEANPAGQGACFKVAYRM
jgi:two-component sensor histidine kinase